ncbi:MAG: FAD synthetase family protein [Treponema sp.]|jgi:riboflavin kinase/FMN adenylyltransferase|nr:FAD synthetase family protein [Treponema sp.]
MQIINWNEFLERGLPSGKASMTVGVFDGVHKGHKALIEQILPKNVRNTVPVVITFREPVYKSEKIPFIIQSFEEKAAALEALGVEVLIVIDFTEDFSRMTGREFLETLLAHAEIGFFAVGSNFRCGCGLDTDAKAIRDFFTDKGIPVEIVPEVLYNGFPISSSRIRTALAEGDIELAEVLIG